MWGRHQDKYEDLNISNRIMSINWVGLEKGGYPNWWLLWKVKLDDEHNRMEWGSKFWEDPVARGVSSCGKSKTWEWVEIIQIKISLDEHPQLVANFWRESHSCLREREACHHLWTASLAPRCLFWCCQVIRFAGFQGGDCTKVCSQQPRVRCWQFLIRMTLDNFGCASLDRQGWRNQIATLGCVPVAILTYLDIVRLWKLGPWQSSCDSVQCHGPSLLRAVGTEDCQLPGVLHLAAQVGHLPIFQIPKEIVLREELARKSSLGER